MKDLFQLRPVPASASSKTRSPPKARSSPPVHCGYRDVRIPSLPIFPAQKGTAQKGTDPLVPLKNPAIGRKNYLFVGGIGGGRNAAIFYSLVSSAKAYGVEPFAWLQDLFTRLPYHRDGESFAQSGSGQPVTSNELDALLPDRWLIDHPEHAWTIDTIRREERKQKERNRRRKRGKR